MDLGQIIEWAEDIPVLRIVIRILRKVGFIKDYERLYKTENRIKALGNAMIKIKVPFQEILYNKEIKIPCLMILRQKDDSTFASSKMNKFGFITSSRTMGMYILPPLKVAEYELKNRKSVEKFLIEKMGLTSQTKVNIRACILFDLNKDYFSFRHPNTANQENKPIFDLILPQIIEYLGSEKSILFAKKYYLKSKKINERELINSTPLQHIFADFLDNKTFNLLVEKEEEIINSMLKNNQIQDSSFLSLSKVDDNTFKKVFGMFLGNKENIEEIVRNAKNQAEFIANRL